MTEPTKDDLEPRSTPEELVRRTAEGKDEKTPFLALGGVALTVALFAGILIAALATLWFVLAR
jgi:hypothetical protein